MLLLAGMAKAAHRRANKVLKYLRWRSTSPEGEVADGFEGITFDCSLDGAQPLTHIMPWIGAKRGQAGHWEEVPFERYWRDWVNEWRPSGSPKFAWGGGVLLLLVGAGPSWAQRIHALA